MKEKSAYPSKSGTELPELLPTIEEKKWGYFRPGYYPIFKESIVPAMVCLSDNGQIEPHIQFVLLKTDCYLKAWQDALFISEQDFEAVTVASEIQCKNSHIQQKIEWLTQNFMEKGYLPLSKINAEIKLNKVH